MSDQRIGTATVCLTPDTLPHAPGRAGTAPPQGPAPSLRGVGGGGVLSVAGELPVGGPVRTRRLGAEPLDLVLLVVGEVALEPEPLALALVGEDVGGHAVEEPPVVADHHGAAGELQERALQAGERLDVQVVRRLVE